MTEHLLPAALEFPLMYRVEDDIRRAILIPGARQPQIIKLWFNFVAAMSLHQELQKACIFMPKGPDGLYMMSFTGLKMQVGHEPKLVAADESEGLVTT